MDFNDALKLVLDLEGRKYTNHPSDRGGPTKWGISQGLYDLYCRRRNLPTRAVATLSEREITTIYHDVFWQLPQDETGTPLCELLPSPTNVIFFQLNVDSPGYDMAVKLLQVALGVLPDGHFGPASRGAIKGDIAYLLLVAQDAHYATVAQEWDQVGLHNRVVKVRAALAALPKAKR